MSQDIVIVSAARTAVGAFGGALGSVPAHMLASECIKSALSRAKLAPTDVSEIVLGQILGAAQGQGPARQAAVAAGIPVDKTAYSLNQICGSGLRAVANGYASIRSGDSDVVVAGGMESMSLSPHALHLRTPTKMGNADVIDTMIKDGLWDAFNGYHMGMTAENVAKQFGLTRDMQDEFAVSSQNKAEAAIKAGKFKDEIVPFVIKDRKGDITVRQDEFPRFGATMEGMAKLKLPFKRTAP